MITPKKCAVLDFGRHQISEVKLIYVIKYELLGCRLCALYKLFLKVADSTMPNCSIQKFVQATMTAEMPMII